MHVNGAPLVLMIFALVTAGFCLKVRKGARILSMCGAAVAVLAVLAIPPWLDALARVFATGPGMVALIVLTVAGGAVFVMGHWKWHHPVWTTVSGIIAGTAVVMTWAMRTQLGAQGAQLGPKTAAAMDTATQQVASGQAASAISPSASLVFLAVGAVLLIAVGRFIHRLHKAREFPNARQFGGPVAALPRGSGGPGGQGGGSGKRPGFIRRMIGG